MPSRINVKHIGFLAFNLSLQREKGKYCDVCICVEEKRFLAHKCILSANCAKLDSLIIDAIGQSSSNHDIEIEIQGVSSVGFKTLLEYFYTGILNLASETVMSVWMTAAYLELSKVVKLCNDFCQQSVMCVSSRTEDISKPSISATTTNNSSTSEEQIEVSIVTTPTLSDSETSVLDMDDIEDRDDIEDEGSTKVLTPLQNALGGGTTCPEEFSSPSISSTVLSRLPASKIVELEESPRLDHQPGCVDMMKEVERLRIQHEKLQRLQLAKASTTVSSFKTRYKRRSSTANKKIRRSKMNLRSGSDPKTNSPLDETETAVQAIEGDQLSSPVKSFFVTPPPPPPPIEFKHVTKKFLRGLYTKYSLEQEPPIESTCSAEELFPRGKSRSRNTTEQNALNNMIRLILEALSITESTDAAVSDALFLVMDRFACLRECMNDPSIRKSLLLKIRHSIHCRKWRVKRRLIRNAEAHPPNFTDETMVKRESGEDDLHG